MDDDFDEFVRGQSLGLLRTAYLLTGDRGHAEDLVQEVLERVYFKWRFIRTSPVAYARRALVHRATDRWRAYRRRPQTSLLTDRAESQAPDHADAYVAQDAIVRALATLPAQQRAILVLRFLDDLSIADTAEVLGCSVGTVKSQASRGLARLRELIDLDNNDLSRSAP